jgi:hypothetical protein
LPQPQSARALTELDRHNLPLHAGGTRPPPYGSQRVVS